MSRLYYIWPTLKFINIMKDITELKKIIDNLTEKDKSEVMKYLEKDTELSSTDKNFIWAYMFPRPALDRESPERIQAVRKKLGNSGVGFLEPEDSETIILLELSRTSQYGRFIYHLLHAFTDPTKIFPVAGTGKDECSLCGKKLYEYDIWDKNCKYNPGNPESQRKEYLAFGSSESKVTLCLDCLIQLQHLNDWLKILKGPSYLESGNWQNTYNNPSEP